MVSKAPSFCWWPSFSIHVCINSKAESEQSLCFSCCPLRLCIAKLILEPPSEIRPGIILSRFAMLHLSVRNCASCLSPTPPHTPYFFPSAATAACIPAQVAPILCLCNHCDNSTPTTRRSHRVSTTHAATPRRSTEEQHERRDPSERCSCRS